jgi:hypothetical protein
MPQGPGLFGVAQRLAPIARLRLLGGGQYPSARRLDDFGQPAQIAASTLAASIFIRVNNFSAGGALEGHGLILQIEQQIGQRLVMFR